MTLVRKGSVAIAAAVALTLAAGSADAQRRPATPPRAPTKPIVIQGTVPTPQVVTVRPREVPTYSRQVLVPNFYDRDFFAMVLPAYMLVPRRALTGAPALGDTMPPRMNTGSMMMTPAASDTTRRSPAMVSPPATPPATGTPPVVSAGGTSPASARLR